MGDGGRRTGEDGRRETGEAMICESGIANGEAPAGWSCTEVASARSGRPR
jgi:hypothetical protein